MTTIKATCPQCGEMELTPADVRLAVCTNAPLSTYSFTCRGCRHEIAKPADEHIVALLTSGGVPARNWSVPAEALEVRPGSPLTYDDLLDFALHLSGEADLAALAEAGLATTSRSGLRAGEAAGLRKRGAAAT